MSFEQIATIFVLALMVSWSPGPGALHAIYIGTHQSFLRSQIAILGLQCGYLSHLVITVIGLGIVIQDNQWILQTMRWCGFLYLLYLGFSVLSNKKGIRLENQTSQNYTTVRTLFLQSLFINFFNPKSIIFMLAVVSQYIDTSANLWQQTIIIGAVMVFVDCCVMNVYVTLGRSTTFFIKHPKIMLWQNRIIGVVIMCLAVLMIVQ